MNIIELRTRLRALIGNPSTSAVGDTTLDMSINEAYRDLAVKNRIHRTRKVCTMATIIGQNKYTLPNDTTVVRKVRDVTNSRALAMMDADQIVRRGDLEGQVTHWAHIRDWIQFYPMPNEVVTIEVTYEASVASLSAGNPHPLLPEVWHEGIVKLARHKYYDSVGDMGKAIYALNVFKDWVSDMPQPINEEKSQIDAGVRLPGLERGIRRPPNFDEE